MIINLTLFIQMINFFFVYILLRKFLFVPVLQFIEQEKQKNKMVEGIILGLEEQLVLIKKKQQKLHDHLKDYFYLNQPNNNIENLLKKKLYINNKMLFDNKEKNIQKFREELRIILEKKFGL